MFFSLLLSVFRRFDTHFYLCLQSTKLMYTVIKDVKEAVLLEKMKFLVSSTCLLTSFSR